MTSQILYYTCVDPYQGEEDRPHVWLGLHDVTAAPATTATAQHWLRGGGPGMRGSRGHPARNRPPARLALAQLIGFSGLKWLTMPASVQTLQPNWDTVDTLMAIFYPLAWDRSVWKVKQTVPLMVNNTNRLTSELDRTAGTGNIAEHSVMIRKDRWLMKTRTNWTVGK